MRCFVTGGGGFIGSRVVRQMAEQGCEIAILAAPNESLWRIADIRNSIDVVVAELSSRDVVAKFLGSWRPHTCLHTAWYAEPGKYLDSKKNIDCMIDSIALFEDVVSAGCKSIVMIGSCAEYDSDAGYLREDGRTHPETLYAATKLATNLVAEKLAASEKIRFVWARLFYLFGPDEDVRRMIPGVIRTLLEGQEFQASEGDQVRDYVHVDDAASALVTLLQTNVSGVFNVCSGEPVTVRQVMRMIGDELGCPELIRFGAAPRRHWEPPFICGDCSKLRQLGWRPKFELRDALRLAVEYWRSKAKSI